MILVGRTLVILHILECTSTQFT